MGVEVEGIRVTGLLVKDFLREDFVVELDKISRDIEVVALVMMKKNGGKNPPIPVIFNHQNTNEVENKIMHLDCAEPSFLKELSKIIEKRGNEK